MPQQSERRNSVLIILKYFVGLALVHAHSEQASETQEIRNLLDQNVRRYSQMFVRRSPIRNATFVLSQLTKLAQDHAVKSMTWVADNSQITPLFLLLMFARIACYCPHPERRSKSGRTYSVRGRGWDEVWKHLEDLNEFENALNECVLAVVRAGSKEDLTRSRDAGQGFSAHPFRYRRKRKSCRHSNSQPDDIGSQVPCYPHSTWC